MCSAFGSGAAPFYILKFIIEKIIMHIFTLCFISQEQQSLGNTHNTHNLWLAELLHQSGAKGVSPEGKIGWQL